jgi:hypothetical protein
MMTTQPLDEFLTEYEANDNVWWTLGCGDHMNLFDAALDRITELTRQRDDARRIAIDSGVFQNIGGTAYLPDVHLDEADKWRADPVGPVAWDQVQQR